MHPIGMRNNLGVARKLCISIDIHNNLGVARKF